MSAPVEFWRGCVNAWDCDEMGHMNVRVYVAKWWEAMAWTAAALALPAAFRPPTAGTLRPVEQHIRFLAEGRAGAPLSIRGGVVGIEADAAELHHEMLHLDGRPAATFTTTLAHVEVESGRRFPWSMRTRHALADLAWEIPPHGRPRSIDLSAPAPRASRARAEALGIAPIGRTVIGPPDVDAFGVMRPEHLIGRISDSVPNLLGPWRTQTAERAAAEAAREIAPGAAVVEARLWYLRWPRAGDLVEIRSATVEAAEKFQRIVHWALDPVSGAAWAAAEVIAVTFDLHTRKLIAPNAEMRAALAARAVPALRE